MSRASACRSSFWLRKLHSLTGFAFLGYFLCRHVQGGESYDTSALRVLCLYGPLLFHALYGLYIGYESLPNTVQYPWARNGMYLGQRVSGVLVFGFLPLHVGAARWGAAYAGAAWYRVVWYVGLLAAAAHFSNGLFGTSIHWGVTVGPHSQKVMVGLSFLVCLALAGYGLHTLSSF